MVFSTLYSPVFSMIALLLHFPGLPQNAAYTPKPNSVERKQILDALRSPVESELRKAVVFKVDHLKLQSGWAFMRGVPQQRSGKKMDYSGTPYEEAIKEGAFDDWVCALLHKEKDGWRVVKYVIGATDVPYEGWDKEFNAPPDIFRRM
ncbi:MAG TPA: hypothetical protein VKA70_00825 [Blastocatellia bacterium]|nr:hypothetical protein [Blastocatellia bacterium]